MYNYKISINTQNVSMFSRLYSVFTLSICDRPEWQVPKWQRQARLWVIGAPLVMPFPMMEMDILGYAPETLQVLSY